MRKADVLVLGGGIAGVAAALAAAAAGARTILIRSGPGATTVCGGGWRGTPPEPFREALSAELTLAPCDGPLPHPDGRLISFECAAPSQALAAVTVGAERALVCGISGLPGFRATALAAVWSEAAELEGHALEAVTIRLAETPAAGWSAVSLGAVLERDPERLAGPLAHAVRERGAARVIVPAILGVDQHEHVCEVVRRRTGVVVGEALGAAPSLPGWRLDRGLLRALERAGVDVLTGFVTEHAAAHREVRLVTVAGFEDAVGVQPDAVVLATGKFLGGGITAQTRFVESALNTEVSVDRLGREIRDAKESLTMTDAVRAAPQPMLRVGVRTNEDGQPVTARGDVVFANVFAAGSVRAGTETASLGLGNAARDGWDAGTRAARCAART